MRAVILLVCFVVGAPGVVRARVDRASSAAEGARRRELMAELAAAAAEAPPAAGTESETDEKTDADLMYEALREWRGEPRDGAAVARVLAESQRVHQARELAEAKLRWLFFKDPFADDPNLLIPVRKIDRQLLAAYEARHDLDRSTGGPDEVARLRAQLANARADAAAARAEASRLRGELARSGNAAGGACLGRAAVGGAGRLHESRRRTWHDRVSDGFAVDPPGREQSIRARPPAGWRSSDPRGIIVIPIDTPVSIRADIPR